MVDDQTEALLQDEAFGEGAVDAAALAAALGGSAEAQERLAHLQDLADALREPGAVTLPASLAPAVMRVVGAGRPRQNRHEDSRGESMNKKWIVGIAATVAAALGIYIAAGGAIPPQGTEGTVGAAKRYQGAQLAASDVQLGDQAMQSFLQSTLFDKLRRDPALRKSFVKVVATPAFSRLANDAAFSKLASSDAFLKLASDAELRRRLATDTEFRRSISMLANDAEFARLANSDAFLKLASDAELRRRLTTDTEFRRNLSMLANDAEFARLATDADFKQLLLDADFARLVQDAEFSNLLQDASLRQLLTEANLKQLATDADFAKLATDAAARKSGEGQKDF